MPRKLWSFSVGPHGARVQAKEREWGGTVYLYGWDAEIGGKRGRSLGFRVRRADGKLLQLAVIEAKSQASELSNRLIQGESPQADLTWGQLFASFKSDVVADMTGSHEREVRRALDCLEEFLGARTPVTRFGVREWRAFIRQRGSGAIDARGLRVADPDKRRTVGPRQIAKDLKTVRQACRYGTQQRSRSGDFLLQVDPTRGLPLPSEQNPARPIAHDQTLKALLGKADQVTMRLPDYKKVRSYLHELLILAAYTGRRIGAIVALRWSDWQSEQGPHGSIRWRAATDKLGRETVVPVHPIVREALESLRRDRPGIGEGWIFPAPGSDGHVDTTLASRWLRKAEKLAEIPHVRGFGFHAFRRMFATSRKHLPVQDVAAAGGWKGTQVLRDLYQQSDPDTLEAVVLGPRELRVQAGDD